MIQLLEKHRIIVINILSKYPYSFYVFGSRAKGIARKFSDLDLAVKEEISAIDKIKINTELEESNLPFKVDLIELNKIDDVFKGHILPDLIPLDTNSENIQTVN